MNLGSPASTELTDIKNYLAEFLMDKRVIDYPYLLRLLLVRGIIVPFRAPQTAKAYRSIWTKDGSPLITITRQLQEAVTNAVDFPVTIAMRYGTPNIRQAFEKLRSDHPGLEQVILLPLYPHYAMSSYETAVVQAREVHRKGKYSFALETIRPFYNEPGYVAALSQKIAPYLEKEYDHILFSYHGIPESHITKGDITGTHCLKSESCCSVDSPAHKQCYRHQCFVTTKLVTEQLNIPQEKYTLSFQSRLGRAEWLKPYTAELLTQLPSKGIKKLLIVCPAFVSDCLETLEEIAEEGKELFLHAGGESFTMIPCLNTDDTWVRTIATWMEELQRGDSELLLS
jgi:ferrochelatase